MDGYEITKAVNDQLSFLSRRKYHMTEEEVERKLKEIEREGGENDWNQQTKNNFFS